MWKYLFIFTIAGLLKFSCGSIGDRSPFYLKCLDRCSLLNCTDDGINFIKVYNQPMYLKWTYWYCSDECKYNCMWKTVDYFHKHDLKTPQFHGKWPFIRFFGIQEPASAVFSLLNLYAHIKMFKLFIKKVRPDSPLYFMWIGYCAICCHAWFWSTIFHARDIIFTEVLDYICAFSIVLVNCYVMTLRLLKFILPRFVLIIITVFFIAFFMNHSIYLFTGKFNYTYNMKLNILVGTYTAVCWFIWCYVNRRKQPYVWRCALYVALTGLVLPLEVIDEPPFYYIFDSHSLWHLATAPLVFLFYSFAIDDCNYLRKMHVDIIEIGKEKTKEK